MIIGTGIDMTEVSRVIEKIDKNNGFKEKVFSSAEIAYCDSKPNRGEHYAARFAAKEAFLKAIGKGLLISFNLNEIEVVHTHDHQPQLVLHGIFKELAIENHWNRIHLSLSHVHEVACAIVIIEP